MNNFASLKHEESKMEGKSKNIQLQQEEEKAEQMNKLESQVVY